MRRWSTGTNDMAASKLYNKILETFDGVLFFSYITEWLRRSNSQFVRHDSIGRGINSYTYLNLKIFIITKTFFHMIAISCSARHEFTEYC